MVSKIVNMDLKPAHTRVKVYVLEESKKEDFFKFCEENVRNWLIDGLCKQVDFWTCEQKWMEEGKEKSLTVLVVAASACKLGYEDWYKIPGIMEYLEGGYAESYITIVPRPELGIKQGFFGRILSYLGWQVRRIRDLFPAT